MSSHVQRVFSDSALLFLWRSAGADVGEMHAGTTERCRVCSMSAMSATCGEYTAPALFSAPSPALHAASGPVRLSLRSVHGSSLHAGGERGESGERGSAAARPGVRRETQDGEHRLVHQFISSVFHSSHENVSGALYTTQDINLSS